MSSKKLVPQPKVDYSGQIEVDCPEYARELFMQQFREEAGLEKPERTILQRYNEFPVDMRTFVCHSQYLNQSGAMYPRVLDAMCELNEFGRYVEAVLTGAIGTGKTTIALYSTAYQLYRDRKSVV